MPRRTSRRPQSPQPVSFEPLEERVLMAATPITFTDGDGTDVKISLFGNGAMSLIDDGGMFDLQITGADQGTRLSFTTRGGDGRATFDDITVAGAMRSIIGKTVDLLGDITLTGSITEINLGNLNAGGPHTIAIGGIASAKPAKITLIRALDLTVESGAPLDFIKVTDWDDTADDDLISAPSLKRLESKEDLHANLRLIADDDGKAKLGTVIVKAQLDGTWFVDGDAGPVTADAFASTFSLNATGKLGKVEAKQDLSGLFAATTIQSVKAGGDVIDAIILAGADLGLDARLGGAGENADLFFRGTLGAVTVRGQVVNSVIAAGLDPANGLFADGDDFVTGKKRSTVGAIRVTGGAGGDTLFAAGKFASVFIGGTRIDPAGDPRFLLASTEQDETPPVIVAGLRTNTGDPNDNITSDPTIVGRVTDLGQVVAFRVGIDDDELDDFKPILVLIEPNGTFELLRSKIEQINAGPLSVGLHTINFFARDEIGNTAAIVTVTFFFQP